jgi:hypothetical protein
MFDLKKFILEEAKNRFLLEAKTGIVSSGYKAERHTKKYIVPFIGQKNTHILRRNVPGIDSGSKVTIHSTRVINGIHHAVISSNDGKKIEVSHSVLDKPSSAVKNTGDAGFKKETELGDKLKSHGLMDPETPTAGSSTKYHDFHLISKRKNKRFAGIEKKQIGGESKISLKAKMGAISFHHTPEKGWHIKDENRKKKPKFASAIENATVNGKPLLQHMNEHWGDPTKTDKLPNITTDGTDLHPLHAYASDAGVDVLHVHSHGTFRVGSSEKRDRTGLNLPKPEGSGRFTIGPERAGGAVHGAFRPLSKGFEKSNVDLMNDEHLNNIKKLLGH